jgi:putative PEP-CTERM system TPR-repeat lipoprotein
VLTQTTLRSLSALGMAALIVACGGPDPTKSLAAAKSHLEKKDGAAAVIELKNALQAKPDLAEARLLLGTMLLGLDDSVGASVELAKALDLRVPPDEVVPLLARAYLRSGQPRKVVELDHTSVLTSPAAVSDLKTSLAQAHAMLYATPKAEAALADALRAKPDHPAALLLQARVLANRGDAEQAGRIVDAVLAKAPGDAEAVRSKGELLLRANDLDGALAQFRKALEIDAGDVSAHAAVMNLLLRRADLDGAAKQLASLQQVRPRHLQTIFYDARIALARGDTKAGEERLQVLLKGAPDNREVLYMAGAFALQKGELLAAEQHLGKLVQIEPGSIDARQMLARVYLRSGEPAKVLETLAPVLESPSPTAEALSMAGSASLVSGDAKTAEGYLARAAKLRPDDAAGKTALVVARAMQGDAERGMADLERLAEADKGTSADLALIGAQLRRSRFDLALKSIDRLERKQPGVPLPLQLRGQALRMKGDAAGARAAFERALQADPKYFAAVDALAALDLRERKPEAALARLEAFLKTDSGGRTHLALAAVEERLGRPPADIVARLNMAVAAAPSDPLARRRLVQFHASRSDAKAALIAAQEANAALPNDATILALLGASQSMVGELNQAIATYNRLVQLRPKSPEPLVALAEAHLAANAMGAAEEAAARALKLAPDSPAVLQAVASIDLRAGRKQQALDRARGVQKSVPKLARGWVLEGDIASAARDWPLAVAAYRTALQKAPSSPVAARLHGALLASGDVPAATSFAAEWQRGHAKDTVFLFHLASTRIVEKQYDLATDALRQLLVVQPENASALNNLGWVLATQKKPGAVEAARKATQLAPNQPAFLDTLGLALASEGKLKEAIEVQKQVLTLVPQAHVFRLRLARLYVEVGDKVAAGRELDALANLGDAFAQQAEVRDLRGKL